MASGQKAGVLSLCFLVLSVQAGTTAALPENAYVWKSHEVYRFEYLKKITLKQNDVRDQPVERVMEISGVLILEIRAVSAAGAVALMRIDSPQITLPESVHFSSQYDEPEPKAGKSRSIAHAMQGAIKAARWTVQLSPNGLIYIEARTPKDLTEWLKETRNAAGWHWKSAAEALPRLLEQDLGLRVPCHDRELLLYLGSAAPAASRKADVLHPTRDKLKLESQDSSKALLNFERSAPKQSDPLTVPDLQIQDSITARLEDVSTRQGQAVFDVKLGMLDSLDEDYNATLKYRYEPDLTLQQQVRVQYRLKRLNPAIATP